MAWENRIIGYGEEDPEQLLANPRNWRIHPQEQQAALTASLDRIGIVGTITVNQRTGFVVDGHLRVQLAMRSGQPTVPVTYVDLSAEEEAAVLATFDRITAMAVTDDEKLSELLASIDDEDLARVLETVAAGDGWGAQEEATAAPYSLATQGLHYEVVGECPEAAELYDQAKAEDLVAEIMATQMDDETRAFLLAAAQRHVVFDYRRVAEFYPHASPAVQRLMEHSALVIIDFQDALRLGYARLSASLLELEAGDRAD